MDLLDTAPTFLTPAGYEEQARHARERGLPQLAAFWERRAHQSAVNEERALATARQVIADARLSSALEYEAMNALESTMERRS